MEAHEMKAPLIRPIGERFVHPVHGEVFAVERSGCDGCIYSSARNSGNFLACHAPERLELTGSCVAHERFDGASVQFVKPNDYAVYKLIGEWP